MAILHIVFLFVIHIIILTGLPAPLNDVPQGRHFFIRKYFMNEVKPHLSYEGQINKLRGKECIIDDDSFCRNILEFSLQCLPDFKSPKLQNEDSGVQYFL